MLEVSGNTLQQVEKFMDLGVVPHLTEGGARRLIHGLVKLSLCGHETGAFKHRKAANFKFLNRSLFRSLSMVMNLG